MHEQSLRVCMIPFDTNKTKAGNTAWCDILVVGLRRVEGADSCLEATCSPFWSLLFYFILFLAICACHSWVFVQLGKLL